MEQIHAAENIKRLRTFHGYRQRELAAHLHISRQAYSNYERGTRLPDLQTAARLARFYHISLDCLIWSEDPARSQWEQASRSQNRLSNAGLTEAGSLIPLNGRESRFLLRYKRLSENEKREVEAYAEFREQREGRKEKRG